LVRKSAGKKRSSPARPISAGTARFFKLNAEIGGGGSLLAGEEHWREGGWIGNEEMWGYKPLYPYG